MVLYVGEQEDGILFDRLIAQAGGFAYLPQCAMETLAMYIQYMPDAVVIDVQTSFAAEVHGHLRDVDARPMILVGEQNVAWADDRIYRQGDDLVAIIQCRLAERQQADFPIKEFAPC
jgi:hypothetical protein